MVKAVIKTRVKKSRFQPVLTHVLMTEDWFKLAIIPRSLTLKVVTKSLASALVRGKFWLPACILTPYNGRINAVLSCCGGRIEFMYQNIKCLHYSSATCDIKLQSGTVNLSWTNVQ
ncbi:hypothetical protein scyTo_0003451 [Scyliorhinus torazame]|uniref:Uncharacterized protein n=1 Tax=Scyliorhinus torazame TaxID=75743 RepID=A0A401PMQ5_SCYTO|nr:hypothetical protein [Scyliorhinus torazame]